MAARVSTRETVEATGLGSGVTCHLIVPPERGSELACDALTLAAHAVLELRDDVHDTLLFAHDGSGALATGSGEHAIAGACSLLVARRDGRDAARR